MSLNITIRDDAQGVVHEASCCHVVLIEATAKGREVTMRVAAAVADGITDANYSRVLAFALSALAAQCLDCDVLSSDAASAARQLVALSGGRTELTQPA